MTFLPIVERELRVAARHKFTWRSRLVAALFALLVFGLLQALASLSQGALPAGPTEFAVLKWMTFSFACCAGIFLTSDSISEEKREGTLGLLFLTDLRGYDVVFGKLLSQSLRAFYAVLAAFPILALPLLVGGLTGREFTLSLLVIVNTLFFSLALGLLVSTLSRDYTKAVSATVLVCLLFFLGLDFMDSAFAAARHRAFQPCFSLANPVWLFSVTGSFASRQFWMSLGLQHLLAWASLWGASLLAPRRWQERAAHSEASRPTLSLRWRFGGPDARAAMRRRWMEIGPVHWLANRDRWLPRLVALLTLLVVALQGAALLAAFHAYYLGSSGSPTILFTQAASGIQQVFRIGLTLRSPPRPARSSSS